MDPVPMLLKLILTLLVPLVIGQLARRFIGPVREWVGKHGKFLKLVSTTLLILIPYVAFAPASLTPPREDAPPSPPNPSPPAAEQVEQGQRST